MECYYKATKAERWCTLNSGTHDYLKLIPGTGGTNEGTFEWVATKEEANPALYRANEGIDIRDGILTFVAKTDKLMFFLNLKEQTYTQYSTICGDFKQEPDNIRSLGKTMYFANDGTFPNAVYGFHKKGGFFKVVMGLDLNSESAGVAFSPDKKIMYVAWQTFGVWQFWREDGYGFDVKPADVIYEVCPAWQTKGTKL
jgi:secreted PhoX family phosphatase